MASSTMFERRRYPMIPVRIFSSWTNAASFTVTCLHSFVFIPCDYFIPLYLQVVLGLSPIISGVSMFALVVPLTIVTCLTGFVVKMTGNFVWPMYFGTIIMTLGTGLFIDFDAQKQWAKIVGYQFVAGIGAGPVFQMPVIALQAHTAAEDLTAAMSAMTFMKSLFTSISIVIGSVILQSKLGGASLSDIHDVKGDRGNYVLALRTMWIFYTCVSAVMVPAALLVKSKSIRRRTERQSVAGK
ncbi:putative MFS transporter superfamily [Septoria linicola]|nr:putative MFS transporter superfamily [Septoria linicola]